jgi:hypothetical protein
MTLKAGITTGTIWGLLLDNGNVLTYPSKSAALERMKAINKEGLWPKPTMVYQRVTIIRSEWMNTEVWSCCQKPIDKGSLLDHCTACHRPIPFGYDDCPSGQQPWHIVAAS